MQNLFASFMLCVWPLVAIYLFATQSLTRAVLWTLMGAQLALPVGAYFKFDMVPQFDKFSIPNFCVLFGILVVGRRPFRVFRGFGLAEFLVVGILLSPIATGLTNGDPTVIGGQLRPSVGLYDAISYAENTLIFMIPFFVGRQFFRQPNDVRDIIYVIAISGLIYSIPLLYEIRMAPTLQAHIYGFAATEFVQTTRSTGYRPVVFMGHGLIASFFAMTTVVASTALWRTRERLFRFPAAGIAGYLAFVLVLCKSFGAIVYGFFLAPILRWTSPRFAVGFATLLVCTALLYPVLRSLDLFPTRSLLEVAAVFSNDRMLSLEYRFTNEDKLLERALERPVFGWGRYGRNRIYSEGEGRDESVTDGLWVITIGQFGFWGFITQFGLLSLGVFRARSALRLVGSQRDAVYLSALALIVAINMIELIPNSSLLPWSWLLCGSLLGRTEALRHATAIVENQPKLGLLADVR